MKQTLFTFMFIISLVLMTACGGSPVDKALAKLDDAIEKLEKKGDKMTKDEMDAIMKDLEEPVSVLNKTIEDNEVGGVTVGTGTTASPATAPANLCAAATCASATTAAGLCPAIATGLRTTSTGIRGSGGRSERSASPGKQV